MLTSPNVHSKETTGRSPKEICRNNVSKMTPHRNGSSTVSEFLLNCFISSVLLVFVLTHVTKKKVFAEVPALLNVLHQVIPAALNPIVYGVRTQEIKQGIQRLLRKAW
ncbi:Olfactory receptor 56A3 [Manis javanica]|nr:Olfactory receptor 56A3 [Manis javanica]